MDRQRAGLFLTSSEFMMKPVISIAAATFGLTLLATPAQAGNVAQIIQSGNLNVTRIDQENADGNQVTVRQGYMWGGTSEGNNVQVRQYVVGNAVVDINQWGNGNNYSVEQHHGWDQEVRINDQYAGGNEISSYSTVTIEQDSSGTHASVNQAGAFHDASIRQRGYGGGVNVADIHQTGNGHSASIFQAGTNLTAVIRQVGN
jgi:hypothetical protein